MTKVNKIVNKLGTNRNRIRFQAADTTMNRFMIYTAGERSAAHNEYRYRLDANVAGSKTNNATHTHTSLHRCTDHTATHTYIDT